MSKCTNCGAENEPAAPRCAYCDGALEATSSLQVAWLARTPEGIQGEGQIDMLAGGGVTAAQVRSAAETAFTDSVRALGTHAKGADVQARMTQQLPALLPSGVEIRELSMTAYRRGVQGGAAPVPARPARGAVLVPLVGLLGGACCLGMGLLMVVVGESTANRIARVEAAPVVANLAEATEGPACLEGVAVRDAEGAIEVTLEGGETARCLYVSGSSTAHTGSGTRGSKSGSAFSKHVDAFVLDDGTRVKVSPSTNWSKPEKLGEAEVDGRSLSLSGIRADAKVLTVVGTARGAELTAEEITTAPTRAALIGDLTETRYVGDAMGLVCLGTGGLLLVVCLGLLFRKRRR